MAISIATLAAMADHPHVVFVFADQWRYQSLGYAGNPQVRTPHLDQLAADSVHFTHAISGCPVCTPARATLLTGQQPLTHGLFMNDRPLRTEGPSLGVAFREAGYQTVWIGKWHVNGGGRSNYIPPERRQGFERFHGLECTHNYNDSPYFADDDPTPRRWEGYDAIAQTDLACRFIRERERDRPLCLCMSWGPPHDPYGTAPERYRALFEPADIALPPNVPEAMADMARDWLAGYYAHCAALDDQIGKLRQTLDEQGIADDTIFVFWSDHGDMLGSQGQERKQRPWDESIRVPLLIHWPAGLGAAHATDAPIDTVDLMPTLCGLAGTPIPDGVEGLDYAPFLRGQAPPPRDDVVIACYCPFGEFDRQRRGGVEYRGLRTRRHTYARTLQGPWLLYDNHDDPHQLRNLVDDPGHHDLLKQLDHTLQQRLDERGDTFEPGERYRERWNYTLLVDHRTGDPIPDA